MVYNENYKIVLKLDKQTVIPNRPCHPRCSKTYRQIVQNNNKYQYLKALYPTTVYNPRSTNRHISYVQQTLYPRRTQISLLVHPPTSKYNGLDATPNPYKYPGCPFHYSDIASCWNLGVVVQEWIFWCTTMHLPSSLVMLVEWHIRLPKHHSSTRPSQKTKPECHIACREI